jgi:hypothetical protein
MIASLGFCAPVAIWDFDEGNGDILNDSSGNGNDGGIIGTPLWVNGVFGSGLYFDGGVTGADYITVADSDTLDLEDAITMAAWAKPEVLGGDGLAGFRFILKKEAVYTFYLVGSQVNFAVANPSEAWQGTVGATSINENEWIHVAGTFDGSKILLYINGELDGEVDYEGTIEATDRVLMMGANVLNNEVTRNVSAFVGIMDEIAIFDEALSQDEIKALMTEGIGFTAAAVGPEGMLSLTWGAIKCR